MNGDDPPEAVYLTPAPTSITIVANIVDDTVKFLNFSTTANYQEINPGNAPEAPFFNTFLGQGVINSTIGNQSQELIQFTGGTIKFNNIPIP